MMEPRQCLSYSITTDVVFQSTLTAMVTGAVLKISFPVILAIFYSLHSNCMFFSNFVLHRNAVCCWGYSEKIAHMSFGKNNKHYDFLGSGWCRDEQGYSIIKSPNCDARPKGTRTDLVVIHNISLPLGKFGGGEIEDLFLNQLCSIILRKGWPDKKGIGF